MNVILTIQHGKKSHGKFINAMAEVGYITLAERGNRFTNTLFQRGLLSCNGVTLAPKSGSTLMILRIVGADTTSGGDRREFTGGIMLWIDVGLWNRRILGGERLKGTCAVD